MPPDVQADAAKAAEQLRELQPTRERLAKAIGLIHQLRGFIAGKRLELPIEVDQELSVLVRDDLQARKEQQS